MTPPTRRRVLALMPGLALAATAGSVRAGTLDRAPVSRRTAGSTAEAGNALGARLLAEMAGTAGGKSVVLSPYGVSAALNLLALGAEGPALGMTRRALGPSNVNETTIRQAHAAIVRALAEGSTAGTVITTATAAWLAPKLTVDQRFLAAAQDTFAARVANADFAHPDTLAAINRWGAETTRGLIPQVLVELDPTTELVLTNAVYFKGTWATAFDKKETRSAPFTRADGSTRQVTMMTARLTIGYAQAAGAHAVALPYTGGRFRMIVLTALDKAKSAEVWRRLTARPGIAAALSKLKFVAQEVDVRLPRFRAELSEDLSGALGRLGFAEVLAGRLPLTRLTAGRLAALKVVQRAILDVNETGTEAAAITGVLGSRALTGGPVEFSADRPFLVALTDTETGVLLFLGYIADP